ncbi:MAG: Spy/CpxP family protein refolding chaperone [Proteobacteria bacterium]|nr:Spy/CpxP family protein refolding chaperone [Pseudomonadota bacterium]
MYRINRTISAVLAALPVLAFAGALQAEETAPDPGAMGAPMHAHHHEMHGHMPMAGAGLMGVLGQLELTPAQKEQIHGIMQAEHAQMRSDRQREIADLPALGNPGDPQHAAAVQSAQKRAADRVQQRNNVDQQIYAILTPAQQAQLPKLLTAMQQHMSQHLDHAEPAGH